MQRDQAEQVPTEFQLAIVDKVLDSLNSVPNYGQIKSKISRTGKPFTWWQRNISGVGKVKYKNIYISSNNKDKSNNSVKAKGSATANTGDSTIITAAPQKNVTKGKAVEVKGDGNKVSTENGGFPLIGWIGIGAVLYGVGRVAWWAYKKFSVTKIIS